MPTGLSVPTDAIRDHDGIGVFGRTSLASLVDHESTVLLVEEDSQT